MKRFAALLMLATLALGANAQQQRRQLRARPNATTATTVGGCTIYTGVLFSWSYTPNVPVCPTNGTPTSCYTGFTLTDTTASVVIANPGPTALSYQWTPAGGLFYGTRNFALVTNGYDQNGVAMQSTPPATTSVVNSVTCLAGPANLTAVKQ